MQPSPEPILWDSDLPLPFPHHRPDNQPHPLFRARLCGCESSVAKCNATCLPTVGQEAFAVSLRKEPGVQAEVQRQGSLLVSTQSAATSGGWKMAGATPESNCCATRLKMGAILRAHTGSPRRFPAGRPAIPYPAVTWLPLNGSFIHCYGAPDEGLAETEHNFGTDCRGRLVRKRRLPGVPGFFGPGIDRASLAPERLLTAGQAWGVAQPPILSRRAAPPPALL